MRYLPSGRQGDAVTEDWTVRPMHAKGDRGWVTSTLREGLATNSYMHGVPEDILAHTTGLVANHIGDQLSGLVAVSADEDAEPAGWVLYKQLPVLTIAYAHVEETYRGLGAWRALRAELGMRDGQLVGVVLASPQAMKLARAKYQAKHNWGMVLQWL
jgi:hypothetical protein